MRFLLDTNICIYIAKHTPPSVKARFLQHRAQDLAMSIITLGELQFGAEKSQHKTHALAVIEQLSRVMEILPLSANAAIHYGQIRAHLQKEGQIIGNNDLWIAAHARSEGCTLVSNNTREFMRVPELKFENWV